MTERSERSQSSAPADAPSAAADPPADPIRDPPLPTGSQRPAPGPGGDKTAAGSSGGKWSAEKQRRARVAGRAGARTPDETKDFLERARKALELEGFRSTPFQFRKKGQVFGMVKEHGHELQLHVRAFDDGVIESEVELSNRYVEHLVSPRRSAHAEVHAIFEKHGVETETINEEFETRTGAARETMPRTRTKTTDLVKGAMGLAGALGAVAVARFVQRGRRPARRFLRR